MLGQVRIAERLRDLLVEPAARSKSDTRAMMSSISILAPSTRAASLPTPWGCLLMRSRQGVLFLAGCTPSLTD